jgi:hypothetical protein
MRDDVRGVAGFSRCRRSEAEQEIDSSRVCSEKAVIGQHPIVGLPGWANSDRYHIEARASEADAEALRKLGPNDWEDKLEVMIQSLLAQRLTFCFGPRRHCSNLVDAGQSGCRLVE